LSFTFTVSAPTPPPAPALLEQLAPDLRVRDGEEAVTEWPERLLFLHREEISTRAVELSWEDGELSVRTMSGSAPEDYALARALVRRAAELTGGEIHPEGHAEPIAPEDLDREFGEAWVRGMIDSAVRVSFSLARDRGPIALPGPVRDFWLGPRLAAELESSGSPRWLADRLLAAVRRVQYLDAERYHSSALFRFEQRDGARRSLTVWLPAAACVLTWADYVALPEGGDGDGEVLLIPYDAVAGLAGEHCWLLDERQLVVEPVDLEDWPTLRRRARRVSVALPGPPPANDTQESPAIRLEELPDAHVEADH
jgi:hypothetical protein